MSEARRLPLSFRVWFMASLVVAAGSCAVAPASAVAGSAPQAVSGGAGTEVTSLRTARSETSVDATGVMHTETFAEPIHFRNAEGDWQKIDTSLTRESGGFTNRAGAVEVGVPDDLSSGARVTSGDAWASFTLQGASGAPSVSGSEADYSDVRPGADLSYEALATGLKETLTLADASATHEYAFSLRVASGLAAELDHSGAVRLTGADGKLRLVVAAPTAWDAKHRFAPAAKLSTTLEATGASTYRYVVGLDPRWLQSKDRAFPVLLDPTITTPSSSNCKLAIQDGQYPDTTYCNSDNSGQWVIGASNGEGNTTDRRLARFDVSAVPEGAEVLQSNLALHWSWNPAPTSDALNAYAENRSWTSGATWNRYDGTNAWTTPGGDYDSTDPLSNLSSTGDGWRRMDTTALTQFWVASARDGGNGVLLKTTENPTITCDPNDGCSGSDITAFDSAIAADPNVRPRLEITWEQGVGDKRQYSFDSFQLTDRTTASVNQASGNLLVSTRNLGIRGTGLDLNIDQNYNSRTDRRGAAGPRETLSLSDDIRLTSYPKDRYTSALVFNGPGGEQHTFLDYDHGVYASPASINATMTDNGGGYLLRFNETGIGYEFNSAGRLSAVADRNGNRITLTRDTNGRLSGYTDAQGKTVSVLYDAQGRVGSLQDKGQDGMLDRTVVYGYDTSGRLISLTDADNKTTFFDFNAQNQLWRIRTPENRQTKFDYDAQGRVAHVYQVTDIAQGTQDTTTYAYGGSTGCPAGSLGTDTVSNAAARTTAHCYDRDLRVLQSTDGLGHGSGCTLNDQSNPIVCTDAMQRQTQYGYFDSNNDRLSRITDPASAGGRQGARTSIDYDSNATGPDKYLPKTITDPQKNSQTLAYDSSGNLKSNTSQLPSPALGIALEYNTDGTVKSSKDGNGNPTAYGPYVNKRLTHVDPPLEGVNPSALGAEDYTYDDAGRVRTYTDGKRQTRTYDYDPLDRIKKITYSDATYDTFTYDGDGNLRTRATPAGTTSFYTDAIGRPDYTVYPQAGTVDYGYLGPDLTSIVDSSGTVAYDYDAAGRLSHVTDPGNLKTTFTYYDDGSPKTTTFPNGVVQTTEYDLAGRPTRISAKRSTITLVDLNYSYLDASGTTTQDANLLLSVRDALTNQTATYTYDALNRLKSTTWSGSGTLPANQSWDYDGAGNRTLAGQPTSATYNKSNQLTSSTAQGAFTYDKNGNRLTGGSLAAAYNFRDQTSRFTPSGLTALPLTYFDQAQQEQANDGTGVQQPSNVGVIRRGSDAYTRTPSGQLNTVRLNGGARYYPLRDLLGSTIALTDTAGNAAARYTYDSWGNLDTSRSTGLTIANPWRYVGGYELATTGLTKFGARYYDPKQGRWTQPDPLKQIADPRQANVYPYAGDDPVNSSDPSGMNVFTDAYNFGKKTYKGALEKAGEVGTAVCAVRGFQDLRYSGRVGSYLANPSNYPRAASNFVKCIDPTNLSG